MKKLTMILLLTINWLVIDAARFPILPKIGRDYTLTEIKNFSLSDEVIASQWRENLLIRLNSELRLAGKNIILNENNISWVFNQCRIERRTLTNFTNSGKIGVVMDFFPDEIFTGDVAVFYFDELEIVVFKMECANLLIVPSKRTIMQKIPIIPEIPKTNPLPNYNPPSIPDTAVEETVVIKKRRIVYADDEVYGGYQNYQQEVYQPSGVVVHLGLNLGGEYYRSGYNNYYNQGYHQQSFRQVSMTRVVNNNDHSYNQREQQPRGSMSGRRGSNGGGYNTGGNTSSNHGGMSGGTGSSSSSRGSGGGRAH